MLDTCEYREEIRKSRFITIAAPISTPADAQAFLEQHSDLAATHNCWAWKIGAQYRSSDDPTAVGDLNGEIETFLDAGMDNFFTDNPDVGQEART